MIASKFKGEITADGKLIVHLPKGTRPGQVDVIVLRSSTRRSRRRVPGSHPAFGIWAKRSDVQDSVLFALELRRRMESRTDGGN